MGKYTLCDVCETPLAKARHWWKEYYRIGALAEHIFSDGYGGSALKEEVHICPECWDKIVKKLKHKPNQPIRNK